MGAYLAGQLMDSSMAFPGSDLLEVPIPYIRPIFQAYVSEYPHKIWPYMVLTYLHFRILKFPLRQSFIKLSINR